MSTSVLATTGRILHRLLTRHGLEADALFIECGLDPLKLDDPRARYPLDRFRTLWKLADGYIPDRCWGLAAGEVSRPTDLHALGYAFLASQTLEGALYRLERYTRIVVQDAVSRVAKDDKSLSITYGAPETDGHITPLIDSRLSVVLGLCRQVYGPDLSLREVQLPHGWQACSYEEFCGCPVRYDTECLRVLFPLEIVRRPLPASNRELAQANDRILSDFVRTLSDSSITTRVRRAVMEGLCAGKPSASDVARALAISPRTLQRRLQEEGTTFQEIADDVRKDLAIQYVQGGEHDLSEVAYLTGFASPSAFSRAYKGWTGHTPSEDRGRG